MRRTIAMLLGAVLLVGCMTRPAPQERPPAGKPPQQAQVPAQFDVVIKGGTIIDGSGGAGYPGDVALQGDKIVAVGDIGPYRAAREIDATGMVVAPGFINPHSHTHDYINPFEDFDTTASLMQGITTEFGGVDGRSPLPLADELGRIEKNGTGVNFASFVGQNNIREAVMGEGNKAKPTADELQRMKAMVQESMAAGAFGLSTGLEYRLGPATSTEELIELVKVVKPFGGIYSTHLRSEGARLTEAVEEAIRIGAGAGVPVNISHLKVVGFPNWGKEDRVIGLIEGAIKNGQAVFADVYPYESPDYGINRTLDVGLGFMPPEYLVVTTANEPGYIGKTVAQIAKEQGIAADQTAVRLRTADLRVVALLNSEQAMIRFYQSDWAVVSTDGEAQPKLGDPSEALALSLHRRSYGSYPRLLGHYVREEQLLPLERMVQKMTGAVAERVGLKDRGLLKAGYFADIVLFNPETVADATTWLKPQEYPMGIAYVMVNGQMAVANGERVGGRPGRVLRFGK
jgi:N-acyl-D-amino-acid deacylase